MHAMQYAITLPADYDMQIIRDRVRTRGHLLDDFPGLGLKAYGIRERGVDGAPVNEYAPFYLWAEPEAMNRFLLGDGFRGVVRDFGRPAVRNWQGLFHRPGPAAGALPRAFTRRTVTLAEDADPATVIAQAIAGHEELATTEGVHTTALALDPRRWELVHFTLWADGAPRSAGDRYQVLHLSAPGTGLLGEGQQW
ncbi:DUF4865 family protein [Streptomyces lydicamycinicus]|uniref:DUF4865 domain-containing protein n=1 Tax=Streptomyces lydicamycinicus TaxID=1546107 RepID=A0A0P4RF23_9ACTN|nr:DUF4865 family protein [Streptomyces lydicamycinicus]USA04173.1 DUF4865 family protein [Streptomyces lydicamycinicus]GAO11898.1 hypothetical protein TPA0598_09_01890 [Streptomyces lydicamycinicus]